MTAISMDLKRPILVTGATGYVAGRLIPALLEKGYAVRAMGRSLEKLACRPWARHPGLELVRGDMLDAASIETACSGCHAAFYLVHSMIAQKGRFAEADRKAARNMTAASEAAGLKRIIYLGGLAEAAHGNLSEHLTSRIEVARILQSGRVPTTDLRAAMILGSGSASFEIMRYLVEPAGHDDPPLGALALPADRDQQRDRLPDRLPVAAQHHRGDLRHRRTRHSDLPAAVRHLYGGGRTAEAGHHPGAGAHPHPERLLDSVRHPGADRDRAAADGGPDQQCRLP